jgi:uncharacterized protein
MKFLLWMAVGVVVVMWVLREKKRQRRMSDRPQGSDRGATHSALAEPERMLRCAQCGMHFPASEALLSGSEAFCSPEHRSLHAQHGTQAPR